ncbi:hypothetical protein BGU93_19230 [Clostridioides difficile]|nr:hypothetical protein BGU93_19230 [Clostridioides difficile]
MAIGEGIEKQTKVPIPPNKRNGRKQVIHVKYMNNLRAFKVEMGECTKGGRPEKSQTGAEWRTNPHERHKAR